MLTTIAQDSARLQGLSEINDTKAQNRIVWESKKSEILEGNHIEGAFPALLDTLNFYPNADIKVIEIDTDTETRFVRRYKQDSLPEELSPGVRLSFFPHQYRNTKKELNGRYALILESDIGTPEEQLERLIKLGLPLPYLTYLTGGKSLHTYFVVECRGVSIESFNATQVALGVVIQGDSATWGINQAWRLPVNLPHQETEKLGRITSFDGNIVDFQDLANLAPDLPGAQHLYKGDLIKIQKRFVFNINGRTYAPGKALEILAEESDRLEKVKENKYLIDGKYEVGLYKGHIRFQSGVSRKEKRELLESLGSTSQVINPNIVKNILRPELPFSRVQTTEYLTPAILDLKDDGESLYVKAGQDPELSRILDAEILGLKANTGKGKSTWAVKLLELTKMLPYTDVITPGVAIGRKSAQETGTLYYQDAIRENKELSDRTQGVTACINSAWKFPIPDYSFVLWITEASAVLKAIAEGGTFTPEQQVKAIDDLERKVKKASLVIVDDANLQPEDLEWFVKVRGIDADSSKIYVLSNTTPVEKDIIELKGSETAVIQMILDNIAEGKKVWVNGTSKKLINKIAEKAYEENPSLIAEVVTGETSCEEGPKQLIADCQDYLETNNIQAVLHSPSIKEGVSTKDYIDVQFNLIGGNYLDAFDIMQSIGRVRHSESNPVTRFIHFQKGRNKSYPETQKEIMDRTVKQLAAKPKEGLDYIAKVFGVPVALEQSKNANVIVNDSDLPWLRLALTKQQRSNLTKNNLAYLTRELMKQEGYVFSTQILESDEEKESKLKLELRQITKDLEKASYLERLNAEDINPALLEELEKKIKTDPNKEDLLKIQKAKAKQKLGLEWDEVIQEDDLRFLDKHRQALFLRKVLENKEFAVNADSRNLEFKTVATMPKYRNLEAIHELAQELGIEKYFGRTGILLEPERGEFFNLIQERERRVEALLRVKVGKVGKTIKSVLEAFGVYTKTSLLRIDGKPSRVCLFDAILNEEFSLVYGRIKEKEEKVTETFRIREELREVELEPWETVHIRTEEGFKDNYQVKRVAKDTGLIQLVNQENSENLITVAREDIFRVLPEEEQMRRLGIEEGTTEYYKYKTDNHLF